MGLPSTRSSDPFVSDCDGQHSQPPPPYTPLNNEENTHSAPLLGEEDIPTSEAIIDHEEDMSAYAWLSTCLSILTSGFTKANIALECIHYASNKVLAKASEALCSALNTETLDQKRERLRVFAIEQLINYVGAAREVYFARLNALRGKPKDAGSRVSPSEKELKEIRAAEEEYNSAARLYNCAIDRFNKDCRRRWLSGEVLDKPRGVRNAKYLMFKEEGLHSLSYR